MAVPKPMPPNGPLNDLILEGMKALDTSSIGEFADRAGIGRATMYNLVQGRVSANGTPVKPSIDTLVKLADALHRPTHELLYILEPDARGSQSIQFNTNMIAVPILGYAGAGLGQNRELEETQTFVTRRFANGKRLGAFHIKGDSMAGGKRPIYNDDIVIANFLDKGSSGDTVIACLHDHEYVCKALKIDRFGSFLTSLNPLYTNASPAQIAADQVQEIIGKVVRVIGNVESLEG
jgi:repressor LexA